MNFNDLTNYLDSLYELKAIPARELIVSRNHNVIVNMVYQILGIE